ncbi:epithelial cell transforming 2 pebble isoform X3 [Arctopsyche grandis]|uniref:epithelial cell transforming 2 pebble isoform X3 n=1 Tax=Arctopsyche grandis TaxID=121162 RepID=UPI00406D7ACA
MSATAAPAAPPAPPPLPLPPTPPSNLSDKDVESVDQRICLVGELAKNEELLLAASSFGIPVILSDTGQDILEQDVVTHFVLQDFEGSLFDALRKSSRHRVLGPTAILQLWKQKEKQLPDNVRPLYSLSMRSAFICFTGFRIKEELTHLITLIHHMGGSIRKDMSARVTHLIANSSGGEKYKYATTFRVPVVDRAWVERFWGDRNIVERRALDEALLVEYKLKVFLGCKVCFVGFSEEECQHISDILVENGGETTTLEDPLCSHVVVDEHNTQTVPEVGATTQIVRVEWFWISVQNEEAQDEREYLFEVYLESQASPSRRSSRGSLSSGASGGGATSPPRSPTVGSRTPAIIASSQRLRKRKLRGPEGALHKRRSSVGDAVLLSLSGNLLDCTQSPDGKQSILDEVECVSVSDAARKHMSPRQQVFMELVQTESNYVGILHTIVTIFKQPLEEMSNEEDPSKALLNNTELKIIFGNLVPIYEIHRRMLEELKWSSHNWSEEISIGRIVLKYAPDLVKAYPPFVNFFENMKEMLIQCDREKPRFHAFLKGRQTKPECGRQTLQDLLIRPVQRLPSISLLLDDVLKHTNKSNPDHSALESALIGIKEVMAHVNEDKRKTEGQLQMFDIYNEIDNCPPHLVSSHRSFVSRCEVMELSKDLSGKGDHLVLFLFTDTMEVCKKRSKVFNSKSPPVNGLHHAASKLGSGKSYRHVQLMPLSTVKRVIDIRETEESHKVFALMCRSNQELKEKLYSFTITDETVDKTHFLKQLCRQMANTVCKTDAEKFLACWDFHQLDIDTSDVALGTLSKAFKFASRTRLKVGRAFSFNKTPSKLKRAMSSMISPFGSTSNLSPASQLAQMRLASCNNINELGVVNSSKPEVLVAPLSVQPTRKAKAASMVAGGLRRS